MPRIYFYETPKGEIIDADEINAFRYHRQFKYIGWSDGRFIEAVRFKPRRNDKNIQEAESIDERKIILDAAAAEIEFARNNPDRSPPPDPSRVDIDGKIINDPNILNILR